MLTRTPTHPNRDGATLPKLFDQAAGTISFSGGLPDLSTFPVADFAEQLGRLTRLGGRTLLQYSTPNLASSLVPAVLDLMSKEQVTARAEQLIPTAGSQQGLVAVATALAEPGDAVLCESPAYPGAMAAFRLAGLQPIAVATDDQGAVPESVTAAAARAESVGLRPRFVYVNPTYGNPTGNTMSALRRLDVLDSCRRADLIMVEDNPYGLLGFDGTTHLACAGFDPGRVVYLGTFSKVFAPGLRAGWIVAPNDLAEQLRSAVEVLALSPSPLVQAAIAGFHRKYGWTDLIDGYRRSYADRAECMSDALAERLGPDSSWQWDKPAGGFYLWLRHRDGTHARSAVEAAARHGVLVVGGSHFSIDDDHAHCLRLCFSYPPKDSIIAGVDRLADALHEIDDSLADNDFGPIKEVAA